MKHIKLFLLLLCVTAATASAMAQKSDATIIGHVVDRNTGKHIPYITITLDGTTVGTVTDGSGHYMLMNLPLGTFMLEASAIGYTSKSVEVEIERKNTLECNFKLDEQPFEMDQVVVSATKNETNRKNASSIVNVVSAKLFDNTASTNLAESMNFQPGLRTENTCGNCGSTQLRINGLEGQYSQILLDSRPIFSSLAGVYGLEQLPVSMIERVEVIRGGGSALFGSSAIGGVVNIITKEPLRSSATISNTTNILAGGAKDITTSLNSSYVTDDNKAGIYLFGMVKSKDAYDRNGDGFSETPELKSETVGFRGYYKTSHYSKLTAEYHHITEYRRGGDNLDLPPHEALIAEQINHVIDGGGLNFDYFSPSHKHKFNIYTSAQQITRDSYYGAGKDINAYGNTKDNTFIAGGQYSYLYNLIIPANLTFGAEYTYNKLHDVMMGYQRDLSQTTNVSGLFFQNEWSNERLNFLVGGRLDKHNLIDNAIFSPRVNLRYSPNESVALRASYSSGYRAPQAFNEDLHIEAVAGGVSMIVLDPNLRPEYSNSITASAEFDHSFGNVQGNILFEGFYTELNDVFTLEQLSSEGDNLIWQRSNGSGAVVKGLSADLKVGISNKIEIQAGYTLQESRYNEVEKWSDDVQATRTMFRSPDQYGYFTANSNITDNLRGSIFGNYTGSMLVQHVAGYVANDVNKWTPEFWDFGFKVAYDIKLTNAVTTELSAGVKNILDSYQKDVEQGENKDAGYVYGPSLPRTLFFGVKFSF